MIDIEDSARDWAIGYKPWGDAMLPQEYARHGFEQGAKWMQQAIGLKKITLVNLHTWQAIYNGDTLVYYQDTPFGGDLLNLLGIDNEELCPEDFDLSADDLDRAGMPGSLADLEGMSTRGLIEGRLSEALEAVASLQKELADLGAKDA